MSVPRLRFKDEKCAFPDWAEESLGNIAELTSSKRVYLSDYVNEGVPFYRGKEISELKRNEKPKDILYITRSAYESFKKNYGVPKINDILITAVGTLGNVYRVKDESEFYFKDGNLIWLKNIKISSEFLEVLVDHNNDKLQKSSIGSTQRALTIVELKKLKFNIPTLPEQTKIANFLTAVDEKITHLTQKHSLLTQYKKGVMQQIFSQQLRFKGDDGQEFPEWNENKLADIGEIITGKTPSTTDDSLWDGDIQFVTPTDITEQKYQHSTQRTVVANLKHKVLPKHSIMFTCIASIGKMSLSLFPCITNQQINALIPKNCFDNEYIYYALLNITDFIKSTQANTTLPIINKTEFSKFLLPIPALAEQTKIANFLTAIDDKLTTVQTQLNAMKQYKQGLLQQMFV